MNKSTITNSYVGSDIIILITKLCCVVNQIPISELEMCVCGGGVNLEHKIVIAL